jgi:antitoxin component of MazEF toxin-antitoxin module
MRRKLVKTGNSDALIITKEMKEHLGVREAVAVYYSEGQIILKRPTSFEEAKNASLERFDEAYRKLAE